MKLIVVLGLASTVEFSIVTNDMNYKFQYEFIKQENNSSSNSYNNNNNKNNMNVLNNKNVSVKTY